MIGVDRQVAARALAYADLALVVVAGTVMCRPPLSHRRTK